MRHGNGNLEPNHIRVSALEVEVFTGSLKKGKFRRRLTEAISALPRIAAS